MRVRGEGGDGPAVGVRRLKSRPGFLEKGSGSRPRKWDGPALPGTAFSREGQVLSRAWHPPGVPEWRPECPITSQARAPLSR